MKTFHLNMPEQTSDLQNLAEFWELEQKKLQEGSRVCSTATEKEELFNVYTVKDQPRRASHS